MAAELEIGSEFAGYRVDEMVGRGGMGVVFRATHPGRADSSALKVILPELAADAGFRARFEREARLAAQLEHPNVVPLHGAGEHDGRLFIAMRYVEGTDLEAVIASQGRLHPRHAAAIVADVASALDAAQELGLVHRDVKPGNVLIEVGDGHARAYLTDFGLSKMLTSASGLTKTGRWVGTVDYASPEQVQAGVTDNRSDVYSLGCVVFEMLAGEIPFPRPREVQKVIAHITEPPPLLPEAAAEPEPREALDAVIATALAKEPGERFASAGELANALTRAVESAPQAERSLEAVISEGRAEPHDVDRGAPTAG